MDQYLEGFLPLSSLDENNLVPRSFYAFKVTDGEIPVQGDRITEKNPGVFCRVKHDDMPSFGLKNGFRLPENNSRLHITGTNLRKRHFIVCHVTKCSRFLEHFVSHFESGEGPGDEVGCQ